MYMYVHVLYHIHVLSIIQLQNSSDSAVQLTPPLFHPPTITYTTTSTLSGNAVFVPDSSYQLTDTDENDVYTFTVIVTNIEGASHLMLSIVFVVSYIAVNYIIYT